MTANQKKCAYAAVDFNIHEKPFFAQNMYSMLSKIGWAYISTNIFDFHLKAINKESLFEEKSVEI